MGRATGQAYKATKVEAKLSHIIPPHPASSLIIPDHPTYESNTIYYKGFDKNAVQQLCLEVYALHGQGTDLVLPPRAGRVVTCPSESLNSNATLAYGFSPHEQYQSAWIIISNRVGKTRRKCGPKGNIGNRETNLQ